MEPRPGQHTGAEGDAFQDVGVVAAYQHRPPYPPETFALLAALITTTPRAVLDVGCGRGEIARPLIDHADRIDAVDRSAAMIAAGRRLPGGDSPRLRWLHGRIEEAPLAPPYALVTAGASLHWMDWQIVLPRFGEVLTPGGCLAIVEARATPDPWSMLGEIVARYRTDTYRAAPRDLVAELAWRGLFEVVGDRNTAAVPLVQPIDDYIESYHARAGFSRERMGAARAAAFDAEARHRLLETFGAGSVPLQITARVVWGTPRR
jgi:SAM-dependent methyltransferase